MLRRNMQPLGILHIPDGKSRNNLNTGAALLACSTKGDGTFDTVIRATSGGVAGNAIQIALVGDASAGVTIAQVGTVFTIHYHTGVSTVALVEAAIGALSTKAAPSLIAVDVPGTGATVLGAGAAFAAAHLAGGAAGAFPIPASVRNIYIDPTAASLWYQTENFAAPTSLLNATNAGFPLANGINFGEGLPYFGVQPGYSANGITVYANATALAVFNSSGGAVDVPIFWTGGN